MTTTMFNLFRPKVFTLTLRAESFEYPDGIHTGRFTAVVTYWLRNHRYSNATIQISTGRISKDYLEYTSIHKDVAFYTPSTDSRELNFCTEGIKLFFGKIPKRIYFKIIS